MRRTDLRPTEARWLAKAAVQGVLSYAPRGREVNHYLQRHVSKRLPRSDRDFDWHAQMGVEHLQALDRVRPGLDRSALHCYEFGAGSDLIAPICLWAMGVERQTVVDINPNVGLDLVNDTLRRFATEGDRLERVLGVGLRRPGASAIATVQDLVTRFGINYLAPQDSRAMPLEDASVDFVTSTFTLEHIPPVDIDWDDPATPTTADLVELRGIPLAPEFERFSVIDLGTKHTHLLARPRSEPLL
jgi:hypothetical protein